MGDPTVQFVIRDIQGGRVVLRPERFPGEVQRMQADPEQRDRVVPVDPQALARQQTEQQREQEFGDNAGAAFAGGVVNTLGAGAPTALMGVVDPEAAARAAQIRQGSPNADMAGNILAALVPVLGARGALGRFATGVPGVAMAGGEGAATAVTARTGSRALGLMAGGGVEAGISGAGFALQDSIVNDDPLTAEQLLTTVGPMALLGIGIGAGAGALGRMRQGSGRLANSVFGNGAEVAGDISQNAGIGRAINPVSEALGFGSTEARTLSHASVRREAAEGMQGLRNVTRNLAEQLDATVLAVDGVAQRATTRRPGRFGQLLEGVDGAATGQAAQDLLSGARAGLARGISETSVAAAQGFMREADGVLERAGTRLANAASPAEHLAILDEAQDGLRALQTPTDTSGQLLEHITAAERTVQSQLRALENAASDPELWGQAAAPGARLRTARATYQAQRARLVRDFGVAVTEDGVIRQAIDGERIATVFSEASSNTTSRRTAAISDYLDAADDYQAALASVYESPASETLRANTRAMRAMLDEGSSRANSISLAGEALKKERGEAGLSIVSGGGASPGAIGAGVGGLFGGIPGAVVGGALATTAGAFIRPASFFMRLGRAEQGLLGVFQRRANAFSSLRRTLSGKGARLRTAGTAANTRRLPDVIQRLSSRRDRQADYVAIRDEIRELTANPEAMVGRLEQTAAMADDFPSQYGKASVTAMMAMSYLAHNLPAADLPGPFDHLSTEMPSQAEMDDFVRRARAIEDPYSIVMDAANFTLHPVSVEAVQAVYPEIFADIQGQAARITSELENLPAYQARIAVGTLMAIPVDPSLSPDFISRMQSPAAQTQPQQRQMASSSVRISTSEGTYSRAQSISQNL